MQESHLNIEACAVGPRWGSLERELLKRRRCTRTEPPGHVLQLELRPPEEYQGYIRLKRPVHRSNWRQQSILGRRWHVNSARVHYEEKYPVDFSVFFRSMVLP